MKFGYTIVYVDDVQASLDFYRNAFGFETRFVHKDDMGLQYAELETGATILAFATHSMGEFNLQGSYRKSSPKDEPFGLELVFVTDDVHAAYERALQAGSEGLSRPKRKSWGQTVAYVRAKEGTIVELCTPSK